MDLVRKQSSLASAKVTALVRLCGNTFALRRKGGLLEIRLVSRPKAVKK
jgi:hypothetical protein